MGAMMVSCACFARRVKRPGGGRSSHASQTFSQPNFFQA
jgi:hypothetical protein